MFIHQLVIRVRVCMCERFYANQIPYTACFYALDNVRVLARMHI